MSVRRNKKRISGDVREFIDQANTNVNQLTKSISPLEEELKY